MTMWSIFCIRFLATDCGFRGLATDCGVVGGVEKKPMPSACPTIFVPSCNLTFSNDLTLSRPATFLASNAGVMVQNIFQASPGLRYGIGQFGNGTMRVFAGADHEPSTVCLGSANADGSFSDAVVVRKSGTVAMASNLAVSGSLAAGAGNLDVSSSAASFQTPVELASNLTVRKDAA